MAGLNVDDIIQVTSVQKLAGQTVLNTFHYHVQVASTDLSYLTSIAAFANAFKNLAWSPHPTMIAAASEELTFESIRAQVIYPVRKRYWTTEVDLVGDIVDVSMPPNVAAVIERWSIFADRRGVGSLHLAGVPISRIDQGLLLPAQKTLYEAVAARLVNFATVTGETTSARPMLAGDWADISKTRQVNGTIVQDTSRVMRRRTVGLGI